MCAGSYMFFFHFPPLPSSGFGLDSLFLLHNKYSRHCAGADMGHLGRGDAKQTILRTGPQLFVDDVLWIKPLTFHHTLPIPAGGFYALDPESVSLVKSLWIAMRSIEYMGCHFHSRPFAHFCCDISVTRAWLKQYSPHQKQWHSYTRQSMGGLTLLEISTLICTPIKKKWRYDNLWKVAWCSTLCHWASPVVAEEDIKLTRYFLRLG